MTWTPDEQRSVASAILGSWPGTITQWGREAFSAYVAELEARGMDAGAVLVAVRSWPAGSDFPPSAPNLAAAARVDPGRPTAVEAVRLIVWALAARAPSRSGAWIGDERERADVAAIEERVAECHPLIAAFVRAQGVERLRRLNLDPEHKYAEANRKRLADDWDVFVEASEGRDVALLVGGRRGDGLRGLDPLVAIGGGPRRELEAGE